MKCDLVITRHPGLIDVLMEKGLCDASTKIISHATIDDLKDKVVAGVLPLSLACHCKSVVEISLDIPQELRGKELNSEEVYKYMTGINEYEIRRI